MNYIYRKTIFTLLYEKNGNEKNSANLSDV